MLVFKICNKYLTVFYEKLEAFVLFWLVLLWISTGMGPLTPALKKIKRFSRYTTLQCLIPCSLILRTMGSQGLIKASHSGVSSLLTFTGRLLLYKHGPKQQVHKRKPVPGLELPVHKEGIANLTACKLSSDLIQPETRGHRSIVLSRWLKTARLQPTCREMTRQDFLKLKTPRGRHKVYCV